MNSNPPPLAVRAAAVLSIVFGTGSLVAMAVSFSRGDFSLDLGFLGIPIGQGLLAGKRSARSWALALSGLGFLLIVYPVSWALFTGQFHAATSEDLWLNSAKLLIPLLVCATLFLGLRSAGVRAWFDADSFNRTEGIGWTAPLILVGAIFAIDSAKEDYITRKSLERLFPIHTKFEFRAANRDDPIKSIGYSSDALTPATGQRDPFAPRLSVSTTSSAHGYAVKFSGRSVRPVEVTFTSEGYQPFKYTLNDKSPEVVTLAFQPAN